MFNRINLRAVNRPRWNFRGSVVHLSYHGGKTYKDACLPVAIQGLVGKLGQEPGFPTLWPVIIPLLLVSLCCYVILKFVWEFQTSIIHQVN